MSGRALGELCGERSARAAVGRGSGKDTHIHASVTLCEYVYIKINCQIKE